MPCGEPASSGAQGSQPPPTVEATGSDCVKKGSGMLHLGFIILGCCILIILDPVFTIYGCLSFQLCATAHF